MPPEVSLWIKLRPLNRQPQKSLMIFGQPLESAYEISISPESKSLATKWKLINYKTRRASSWSASKLLFLPRKRPYVEIHS